MQTGPTPPGQVTITPGTGPGSRNARQIAQALLHRLDPDEQVTVTEVVTIRTAPDDWARPADQILFVIQDLLDAEEEAVVKAE